MQSKQLEKSINKVENMGLWLTIIIYTIAIIIRLLLIPAWNIIFSDNVNQFLFGSNELSIGKGILLLIMVEFFTNQVSYNTGGKTNGI